MKQLQILKNIIVIVAFFFVSAVMAKAQNETPTAPPSPPSEKKANQRPTNELKEPFLNASVEKMKAQCVKLETEAGEIDLEMFPESAPESVRNFLNLTALGVYDTTTFSRVIRDFVVQGGNISTRANLTEAIVDRAHRTVPDEPSLIKHERGILSMARPPNSQNAASSQFFILVDAAPNLDGTFAAFGHVINGMDVVDAINKMPVDGEKPVKPVHLNHASIIPCPAQPTT